MEKTYEMVNRENGTFIKCSEKYLIEWVSRGFEVESITFDEAFKEELYKPNPKMITKAKGPHLSSNYVEYFSSLNPPKKRI